MKAKLPIILGLFLAATPSHADISVSLDTSFAESVLADVCSSSQIDEASIRTSESVINMLTHFRQFRDYFTMDAYLAARQKAANCEKSARDIFRFNEVIENREKFASEVAAMQRSQQGYSTKLTSMLAPYVPAGVAYKGRATIAVGTPSCGGWSAGSDFYVDLPCITDDQPGLQYLFAHESYHGLQEKFMQEADENDQLARLFSAIMREGSATAIADFSQIEAGGDYTLKSKQSVRRNAARLQQNFDLFDMAVAYLVQTPTAARYDAVNNIGLSGSYDAPFYAVGATIFNAIEAADGRHKLLCLLQSPAKLMFSRYASLAKEDARLPRFGEALSAWLDENSRSDQKQCVDAQK